MKSKNRARHDAKMRAMREAGKAPSKPSRTGPHAGGLANHAPAKSSTHKARLWRDAASFDDDWLGDEPTLRELLEFELNLLDEDTDELDPDEVESLDEAEVESSATVGNYLDELRDRLQSQLKAKGALTHAKIESELDYFNETTSDQVANRLAQHLVAEFRKETGVA